MMTKTKKKQKQQKHTAHRIHTETRGVRLRLRIEKGVTVSIEQGCTVKSVNVFREECGGTVKRVCIA